VPAGVVELLAHIRQLRQNLTSGRRDSSVLVKAGHRQDEIGECELNSSDTTVAIIGAGYAGVTAANRLRASLTADEAARVRVVMINRTGEFVERIRLHEVAAGTIASAAIPLREMLHDDIEVIVGDVVAIDPDRRLVDVATGAGPRVVRYHTLIYAVGSTAATGVPGAEEFAYLLADPDGALVARDAVATIEPGQRVVVVGGGATGVEAAAEIAEQHPEAEVTLLCGERLLGFMRAGARASIARSLASLGVHVLEQARVARVLERGVELADRTRVPSDVTVWAASFSVPGLARTSGLAVDEIGRLRVDESLRGIDYPDIIGAGDAVRPPASVGSHLRMGCAMAIPLGGHAAETALAALRGTEPRPLSAGFVIQCLSLGRHDGYIQLVHSDDSPRRLHLSGSLGAKVKEMICKLVVSGPRKERAKPGSYWAPAGPPRVAEKVKV
jgi:NADH:ubiquinone reductase (H+-translocating)